VDPDLGSDIVALGFVQNLRLSRRGGGGAGAGATKVSFDVELTTPACPVRDQFAADCERLVLNLPWVDGVEVTMTARDVAAGGGTGEGAPLGMAQVGAIVAVSSCKGGVGKSTTAVNLAYSLQRLGAAVGILDADVFGPSLPTMVRPDDDAVRFVGRQIAPLRRDGVRLMSFGYVNDGSAAMRGPMVAQLLDQFLSVTNWGRLDYLVLDMPPGTGDVQLTLTQRLNITAAVIVTTPQELSFADVVRGVELFDSVQVPSVAVVENMAYYEVDNDDEEGESLDPDAAEGLRQAIRNRLAASEGTFELNGGGSKLDALAKDLVDIVVRQQSIKKREPRRIQIFGPGHKKRLSEQWGIEHTFSVPLMDQIAENGDRGTPHVLQHPDGPAAAVFQDLARAVVSEVAKAKFSGGNRRPGVAYDDEEHVLVVKDESREGRDEGRVPPATLRRACRCASCVEELTGRQLLIASDVPESIKPLRMYPTGNYALSVDWSDGHRSLYPYRQIRALLQEEEEKAESAKQEQAARETNRV
jgi:Mrp family chromosome partitioning ATPase/DUF971 family protein